MTKIENITNVAKNAMKFTILPITILPFRGLKNCPNFVTVVPLPGTNPKQIIKCRVKDLYVLQYLSRGNNLNIRQ